MPGFKEYQMMFQLSATTSGQFQSAFTGAQNSIAQLQSKIDALNKQQSDITAYTKQQQAVEKTKQKLETLKQQYDNLKAAQDKAGGSDVDLQNKMLDKQLQIERTNDKLDQQTTKLDQMGNALEQAGVDTGNLGDASSQLQSELSSLRQQQEQVADSANDMSQGLNDAVSAMQQALVASGLVDGLKQIYETLKQCAEASIQYESAMAGVKRTVGGSDAFIESMGEDFKHLSTEIPITAEELARIATTAGQLGIAQNNVESFTTVMAQLATTTDLTADDAATMLAQFANITGTTQYDRLGSTVAELGDATATTASKVVQMSQGMAAAASQAGFSETDILATSAAVGSLGIEAQAGSTAMSTLISTLYKSVETGNKLQDFASVAGMTASEFKKAWGEDAVGAMNSFIQGLNDTERNGKSAVVILDELGINNVRQTKAILGLASAGDLLSNTIDQANAAWDKNTALADKAGVMYGTTEAKMTMMQNAANNVKIAVGDALTPAIGTLADTATTILEPVAQFIENNPAIVQGLTTIVGVIGGVTAGVLALSAALKVGAAAAAIMTAAIPGLPIILGVTAGVAALAGGAVYLASVLGDTGASFEELNTDFDDLMTQFDEQQAVIDLVDQYHELSDELGNTRSSIKDIQKAGAVGIHITAEVAESGMLTADDFVDNTYVELTPEQASYLAAADFIPGGTLITLTAQTGNTLAAAGFLDNQKVWLTAEAANELLAKGYLDKDTLDLYAKQGNYIEGKGFVTDTEIELTPEAAAYLAGTDFLQGSAVQLTPEAAALLEAKGFLTGTEVELSPEAAALLAAEGFLTGTDVALTPEAAEKLAASGFLDGSEVVLYGKADESGTLSPDDFVNGTLVTITPDLDLDVLNEKLASLRGDIQSVGTDLESAKGTLTTMQSQYDELNLKMLATNDKKEKSALASQMEEVSEAITEQKTKVDQLQSRYDSLNTEFSETQATIDGVVAAQEQLAATKQALIDSSGGLISATDSETEAFENQVDALKSLAEMKQADIRQQAYENILAQSKEYAKAVQNASEYQEQLNAATEKQEETVGLMNGGIDDLQNRLNSAYQTLSNMVTSDDVSFDWDSDEVQSYVSEIENLLYLMTGEKYDFNHMLGLSMAVEDAKGSYEAMHTAWEASNADVEKYANAVLEAKGTQQEFLDNLVTGVQQGGMSLEYLEGLLTEQFSNIEGGEEMVASAMEYVRAAITDASNAAEDFAEGTSEAADSAYDLETSVSPIIKQMEELSKAYDDAYKSAYDSIDGQFELFEKVGKIKIGSQLVNTGEKSMREGLESQAKYMEEYVAMLEKAKEIGVNGDLLAELADGSMESAETLKRLTSETTKPEDIEALNASYELAQQKKAEFASAVAEISTDFSAKMGELQSQMSDTISKMEMSSEAAANAQSTFQAMVSTADSMLPAVRAAYARVAQAAQSALNNIHAPNVEVPGYAVGTQHAAPGYALVGENGPELVYFGGGEEVYTAEQTAAMTRNMEAMPVTANTYPDGDSRGTVIEVNFSPVYNISGNANPEQIRVMLEEHDEGMRTRLEELLNEIAEDERRRAFA